MGYLLHYILQYNSPVTENVVIKLYKKDIYEVPADAPIKLKCTKCSKSYMNGQGQGNDSIIASELNFSFWLPVNSLPTFKDFIVSFHDEWKVEMTSDGQTEFIGFITPGEGTTSLRDKPYELDLSATDNLGLIKSEKLTKQDGTSFTGENTLISYVLASLYKTNLNLNVLLYCNIYESSMQDRNTDPHKDAFNQAKQDYRSYQTDPTTFMDCYTVLQNILGNGFQLTQWYGKWVIMRNGEMQLNAGPKTWFTEYDYQGNIVSAALDLSVPALVGKDQVLHPKNADQTIGADFAVKSAKSTFMYRIWPEIPKNNTFDRGTLFQTDNFPGPPPYTQKRYTIADWLYGVVLPGSPSTFPPNGMQATTDLCYKLVTENQYGVETLREVVLERNGGVAGHRMLRCEGVPVNRFDRITVDLDFKTSQAGTGTRQYLMIILVPDAGGLPYRLDNGGAAPADGVGTLTWVNTSALRFLAKSYQSGEDASNYTSFSLPVPAFPVDGQLYILFLNFDPPIGRVVSYKNFSLTYYPSIAGSSKTLKGDYWFTQQDANYKDIYDDEHFTSDSPKKVIMGALLRNNGTLTTRSWARLDEGPGQMDFKEILNIGRYNLGRRRMWQVKGTFGGTAYYAGLTGLRLPLAFHKHYVFTLPSLADVYFQLVPPVTIDYRNGEISATFREALNLSDNDGTQTGNLHEFKYIFE